MLQAIRKFFCQPLLFFALGFTGIGYIFVWLYDKLSGDKIFKEIEE